MECGPGFLSRRDGARTVLRNRLSIKHQFEDEDEDDDEYEDDWER
jgi:hypothetical protein